MKILQTKLKIAYRYTHIWVWHGEMNKKLEQTRPGFGPVVLDKASDIYVHFYGTIVSLECLAYSSCKFISLS